MSSPYFISYKHQVYFGYVKKKREFKFWQFYLLKIMAIAILASVIIFLVIIFFFPKDKFVSYIPEDALFYLHLNQKIFSDRNNFIYDLNTLFNFDPQISAQEMSWAILPDGQKILLLRTKEEPTDKDINFFKSRYFIERLSKNFFVLANSKKALQGILKNNKKKSLAVNWRRRIFFSLPGRFFFTAYANKRGLQILLPKFLRNKAMPLPKFLVKGYIKRGRVLLHFSDKNIEKKLYQGKTFLNNFPVGTVLAWQGVDIKNIFTLGQNIFFSGISEDNLNFFSGSSEFIVVDKKNNQKRGKGFDWLNYNYLLILKKDQNNFSQDAADLEQFAKEAAAIYFPQEEEKTLEDGTRIIELIAHPEKFIFKHKGDIKYFKYGVDNYEFAYSAYSGKEGNFLIMSNSLNLLNTALKSRFKKGGITVFDFNKECFTKLVRSKSIPFYADSSIFAQNSKFLANFKRILLDEKGSQLCIY